MASRILVDQDNAIGKYVSKSNSFINSPIQLPSFNYQYNNIVKNEGKDFSIDSSIGCTQKPSHSKQDIVGIGSDIQAQKSGFKMQIGPNVRPY